ncbi:MAG: hypothetical protein ABJF23_33760 [Bryobacteraceae bacterium]
MARYLAELTSLPGWVDRATVERLFQVGGRRAQQILAPCVSLQIGSNGLADRDLFVDTCGSSPPAMEQL